MSIEKKNGKKKKTGRVPIKWNFDSEHPVRYANHLVVQYTDSEVNLSFFEVRPPFIVGKKIEQNAESDTPSVKADCVARIVVSPLRFVDFMKVMSRSLENVMKPPSPKNEPTEGEKQ